MRRSLAVLLLLAVAAISAAIPVTPVEAHRGLPAQPGASAVSASAPPAVPVASPRAPATSLVAVEDPAQLPAALAGGTSDLRPAPLPAVVPWWVLLTSLLALAAACPLGRRRSIALGVVLLLAVLAAETGVHSVHHLGNTADAQSCQIAGAAQYLSGIDGEVSALSAVELAASGAAAALPDAPALTRAPAPHAGRAPPVLPA